MNTEQAEILIIGGGIAGLSTAFHLAQTGQPGVMLLERENLPGFYSSGHNAGVGRQLTGRSEHTALTIAGRNRLMEAGLLDERGGLLLGADPGGTDALAREAEAFGLPVERGTGAVLPGLQASEFLRIPSDGFIDTDGALQYCAEGARRGGAVLRFGQMVQRIQPLESGFLVETDEGAIETRRLVNAAGGWVQELGRMAGGLDIPFTPLRRHLVWSGAAHPADQSWAWWADRPIYIRPESGGLLMCACEEQEIPLPPRGEQPDNDPSILEGLCGSLREVAPSFQDYPVTRMWCGLRTFSPDRRFVIGPDPINPDLFWVAGLGGHGMTSGLAVGDLAARALLGEADTGALAPSRFLV
ncbi:MAG: dependent oxidoreductase [Holophagaceae bacterium]|nr:dependent oxidoreductase [Holophagaceae bacterium]